MWQSAAARLGVPTLQEQSEAPAWQDLHAHDAVPQPGLLIHLGCMLHADCNKWAGSLQAWATASMNACLEGTDARSSSDSDSPPCIRCTCGSDRPCQGAELWSGVIAIF